MSLDKTQREITAGRKEWYARVSVSANAGRLVCGTAVRFLRVTRVAFAYFLAALFPSAIWTLCFIVVAALLKIDRLDLSVILSVNASYLIATMIALVLVVNLVNDENFREGEGEGEGEGEYQNEVTEAQNLRYHVSFELGIGCFGAAFAMFAIFMSFTHSLTYLYIAAVLLPLAPWLGRETLDHVSDLKCLRVRHACSKKINLELDNSSES